MAVYRTGPGRVTRRAHPGLPDPAAIASATRSSAASTTGDNGAPASNGCTLDEPHLDVVRVLVLEQPLREPERLVPAEPVQVALGWLEVDELLARHVVHGARLHADPRGVDDDDPPSPRAWRRRRPCRRCRRRRVARPPAGPRSASMRTSTGPAASSPRMQVAAAHDEDVGGRGREPRSPTSTRSATSSVTSGSSAHPHPELGRAACRSCRRRRARCTPGRSRTSGPPERARPGRRGSAIGRADERLLHRADAPDAVARADVPGGGGDHLVVGDLAVLEHDPVRERTARGLGGAEALARGGLGRLGVEVLVQVELVAASAARACSTSAASCTRARTRRQHARADARRSTFLISGSSSWCAAASGRAAIICRASGPTSSGTKPRSGTS